MAIKERDSNEEGRGIMDDDHDREDDDNIYHHDHADKKEERHERVKQHFYSPNHQILLVGDGDFSFSLCLARSFGSASNIVATSLDPYDVMIRKYKEGKSNWESLERLGASLLHCVDATMMKIHPDLRMRKFDRIIFNFPHAGFHGRETNTLVIHRHTSLVDGFLWNARSMLRPNGEIHVNHKTTAPFCDWNIEKLAISNSLFLIERAEFKIEDYPGYKHKRGDGRRCDRPFPLGKSSTFKFGISAKSKKERRRTTSCLRSMHGRKREKLRVQNLSPSFAFDCSQTFHKCFQSGQRLPSFESSYPQSGHGGETNFFNFDDARFSQTVSVRNSEENFRTFRGAVNGYIPTMIPGITSNHDMRFSREFGRRPFYDVISTANELGYELSLNREVHILPGPGHTETLRIVREYAT